MKCQRCPKTATLHITEVLGEGQFEEVHLCEDCANKYLYAPQQKKQDKPDLVVAVEQESEDNTPAGMRCPSCGMSFMEFRNQGRFGCAHDYDAFKSELLALLESVHGETHHTGKSPRRPPRSQSDQAELAQLRQRLQSLVTNEKYEEAARVRDRIRELEAN